MIGDETPREIVSMTPLLHLIATKKFSRAIKALDADPSLVHATSLDEPRAPGVAHYAARSGSVDLMKRVMELGGDIDRAAPQSGYLTPLCEAAGVGDLEMVDLLCKHGARVDGADASALTPLMEAARSAKPACVELLLKRGSDPNRLGFYQRYFPLDFAGWQDSEACRALIRAAGGRSVTDDHDWRSQPGYPIICTVSNEIAAVFPIQLASSSDSTSLRVAQVRKAPRSVYVFTDELHAFGRVELSFWLASSWGVLADYREGRSEQSFPLDVLRTLGALMKTGALRVKEGILFEPSGSVLGHLKWPAGVAALMAVDHNLASAGVVPDKPKECHDVVTLLVLVPLLEKGSWSKGPVQLAKALDTTRKARLPRITMKDPLRS